MRVLLLTQYFYPERFVVNDLAVALKKLGHEVVVLTGQPSYPNRENFKDYEPPSKWQTVYEGVPVYRVPMLSRGEGNFRRLSLNYGSFAASAAVFGLPRLPRKFDVCLSWCISPMTAALPAVLYRKIAHVPTAVWIQDLWPETVLGVTGSENAAFSSALSRLISLIYRNVDQLWIQSPAYRDSLLRHGALDKQIEYVPNWASDLYDCSRWDDVEPDAIPSNALVFAGNLGRAQGLHTMMEAATLIKDSTPEARWVFVGDGSLREWLADQIVERGLQSRVQLLPRRPMEQMPNLLKAASGALVSLTDTPAFRQTIPSKVQTIMASGVPIVGALGGQAAKLVREAQAGVVCEPENAAALASTVSAFFAMSTEDRTELGRNGHAYYKQHFTEESVLDRVDRLLHSLSSLSQT